MEINDKGQVMVHLGRALVEASQHENSLVQYSFRKPAFGVQMGTITWHYNGGWMKTVTGLDKSKDNGFSILGSFADKIEQQAWQKPGLFLDCCTEGSRKRSANYYTLFELTTQGEIIILAQVGAVRDWAVKLWPAVEAFFAPKAGIEPASESQPTLSQQLALAVTIAPSSAEKHRINVFRNFPFASDLSMTDLGNLVDVIGHQARVESGAASDEERSREVTGRIADIARQLRELDALLAPQS